MAWEKEIWIAKRVKIESDEYGVDIEYFEEPKKYRINYQPTSGYLDYLQYGEKIRNRYRAFINNTHCNNIQFNVGDRVYLADGEYQECELEKLACSDNELCEKANYVIDTILPQNIKIRIDFRKR